jgi:hypothetical protein
MKVKRTYPTPDTARDNCGPRERALATFKYLLGLEPEEAIKHHRFDLMVNAFRQQERVALRHFILANAHSYKPDAQRAMLHEAWLDVPPLLTPVEDEFVSPAPREVPATIRKFENNQEQKED